MYMKGYLFIILSIFIYSYPFFGQTTSQSYLLQKKIALIIGNGDYISSILANPENDARAIKVALQSVGFKVIEYENLTQIQMKKAIDDFGEKLKGNDVGLFFYAGHGIQAKGYNYLIPVDAVLKSEEEVEYDCVQADRVLAKMESSGSKVNIIILDACRNNPFERSWTRSATGRGLAFMNAPTGSLIAYATAPGSTASDGSGNNGMYTSAILESIKIPNITIIEMFQNVRNIVTQKSGKQQTPWESTSLTGNFYFERTNPGVTQNTLNQGISGSKLMEEKSSQNEVDSKKDSLGGYTNITIPSENIIFSTTINKNEIVFDINAYYELTGREAIYLPKPEFDDYKEGVYTIPIKVDRDGKVVNINKFVINTNQGMQNIYVINQNGKQTLRYATPFTTLLEKVVSSAKFSLKRDAKKVQDGTITFVIKRK
jgi:hypothetical protein